MLPAAHRLRRSVDFERAVRRGTRAGRSTLVVHLVVNDEGDEPPQVGFVVSKAVGNAVQRNLVKRRLRHAALTHVDELPPGTRAVVRALAPASRATYSELSRDLASSLTRALARVTGDAQGARPASGAPAQPSPSGARP
ncbi:ribonuclease P protein component [Antribacter gilvus]|uniref:ribonuclease P protein component n=1 Tax=Antribacter gilvus TaxID=2304675 RepID=UPI000F76769F|nr:ribonuclease P protein component [Antribacter gilvus]